MAFFTNGNNIKPILRGISFVMMILLCLLTASAFQSISSNQFARCNSVSNSITCFRAFWKTIIMFFGIFRANFFALFAFAIIFNNNLTLFCAIVFCGGYSLTLFACFCLISLLVIFRLAYFACTLMPVFYCLVFMKFRERFNLFAFKTSFCYDLLRHNQFLTNWLCLEPLRSQSPCGLFYYTVNEGNVK